MGNKRLIYGFHAVNARLWQRPESLVAVYMAEDRRDARIQAVVDKATQEKVAVYRVDGARLAAMCSGARHQGIVAYVDASFQYVSLDDVLDGLREPPLLLVLDGVTDPHNLGACLRVADAMGVHAVIAPKNRAVGLNATVSKVACGAAEIIPYLMVTNLARTLRELKEAGVLIVGTTMEAEQGLFQLDTRGPVAWVLGAEGEGMRRLTREHCDVLVSVPMYGTVESLNVSVTAGMLLSETRRQRMVSAGD